MNTQRPTVANCRYIKRDVYYVRTQAGFRKALKHWGWADDDDKSRVFGYPRKYPAIVTIKTGYDGSTYAQCSCLYLDDLEAIDIRLKEDSETLKDPNVARNARTPILKLRS